MFRYARGCKVVEQKIKSKASNMKKLGKSFFVFSLLKALKTLKKLFGIFHNMIAKLFVNKAFLF